MLSATAPAPPTTPPTEQISGSISRSARPATRPPLPRYQRRQIDNSNIIESIDRAGRGLVEALYMLEMIQDRSNNDGFTLVHRRRRRGQARADPIGRPDADLGAAQPRRQTQIRADQQRHPGSDLVGTQQQHRTQIRANNQRRPDSDLARTHPQRRAQPRANQLDRPDPRRTDNRSAWSLADPATLRRTTQLGEWLRYGAGAYINGQRPIDPNGKAVQPTQSSSRPTQDPAKANVPSVPAPASIPFGLSNAAVTYARQATRSLQDQAGSSRQQSQQELIEFNLEDPGRHVINHVCIRELPEGSQTTAQEDGKSSGHISGLDGVTATTTTGDLSDGDGEEFTERVRNLLSAEEFPQFPPGFGGCVFHVRDDSMAPGGVLEPQADIDARSQHNADRAQRQTKVAALAA